MLTLNKVSKHLLKCQKDKKKNSQNKKITQINNYNNKTKVGKEIKLILREKSNI